MRIAKTLAILLSFGAAGFAPAAHAADPGFMADPIYNSPLFNFDGFYVGAQGGGAWFVSPGPGVVGAIGGMAGVNFGITDALLAGIEFQSSVFLNGSGITGYDALALAHFGGFITDSAVLYGAAGGGISQGTTAYAFGAGIEAALKDSVSARIEVLGEGPWGSMPNGAKASLGLVWHVN